MSDTTREKWNGIYAQAAVGEGEPARVLRDYAHLLPAQGRALDLACGMGANALFLARHGLATEAWDISEVAMDKLGHYARSHRLPLTARACDVTAAALPEAVYDVIVVSHFLERMLCPALARALRPGGLLYYQTFTRTVTADYAGPGNESFRLGDNELLELFSGLRLRAYREEGLLGDVRKGWRNEAMLVGQRREEMP
jgi:2-polyprenyl-3-methyl-5-hydroxy-6-metoxy-1,4-benzoquinol methylase